MKPAKIKDMIARHGQTGSITSKTRTAPDASKPWEVDTSTGSESITLAIVPMSANTDRAHIPNTSMENEIARVLIAAFNLTNAPAVGDTIVEADGTKWEIATISKLAPSGLALMYDGVVKK